MCKRKMKTAAFTFILSNFLLGTAELLARPCSDAPPKVPAEEKCCINFTGEASGGTLIFYRYRGSNAKCAAVETTAGEPAEKVVSRLADVIEENNPFGWIIVRGGSRGTGARVVISSGGELKGLVGDCHQYIVAGTEIGLGIPQPPSSLTSNYDPEVNNITLRWVNPSPNAYDYIRINLHKGAGAVVPTVPGNSESCVLDLKKYTESVKAGADFYSRLTPPNSKIIYKDKPGDIKIWVFGVRNDIPSNAATILVNKNVQEELFGIPFTGGIAPNWQRWSLDTNDGIIRLEEGKREGGTNIPPNKYKPASTFDKNSFYQVINTGAKGCTGGVYRKFIGLTQGHTYRIKTRVATLSEPNEKGWSVSVHAAANGPDGRDLSPRQMASLDALPIGSKDFAEGRMALYDSSLNTKGEFSEISTGKTVRGQEIKDITLPMGVDSITVWVKCSSSESLSAAIDWISLEDLSVQKL
ncbi:MAG: hypothetical protein JW749_09570 [Sedimentisphaerales bacterium]|nr:hypothetical protein [Sedimentisphaerales bacterium]